MLDDHVGGAEPDDQQQGDRDEVAEVLADRDAHQPPTARRVGGVERRRSFIAPAAGSRGPATRWPFCLARAASPKVLRVCARRRRGRRRRCPGAGVAPSSRGRLGRRRTGRAAAVRLGGSWFSHGASGLNGVLTEARERRHRSRSIGNGVTPARSSPVLWSVSLDRVGTAAADHADVLAVGVAGAALAADPGEPVAGLLEDRAVGPVLGVVGVAAVDPVVGPGQDRVVEAARERSRLLQERDRVLGQPGEVGDRRPQVGDQAAQLRRLGEAAKLAQQRRRRVERRRARCERRAAPRGRRRGSAGRRH